MRIKYNYVLAGLCIVMMWSCRDAEIPYVTLSGKTMGTTYHITLQTFYEVKLQKDIDSILIDVNNALSTYIDSSTISRFNTSDSLFCFDISSDIYFAPVFKKAKEVYRVSDGAFDPSIMPLVNFYGFGYAEKKKFDPKDSVKIKTLLQLLQFDKIEMDEDSSGLICITKPEQDIQIDFSAIAKGYGVDVLSEFLENNKIRNYLVEIGGEVRTLGLNNKGSEWIIGINKPSEKAGLEEVELPLKISNRSVATSGNYRNMYESKGQKFAHIIDPKTGLSRQTDILSATVISKDCMTADAYATAFMVLGIEKSLLLIEQLKDVEACFIYDLEGDGIFEFKISSGFPRYFLHNEQK